MGTVERQKSGVKIQLAGLRWRLDNPLWQIKTYLPYPDRASPFFEVINEIEW